MWTDLLGFHDFTLKYFLPSNEVNLLPVVSQIFLCENLKTRKAEISPAEIKFQTTETGRGEQCGCRKTRSQKSKNETLFPTDPFGSFDPHK